MPGAMCRRYVFFGTRCDMQLELQRQYTPVLVGWLDLSRWNIRERYFSNFCGSLSACKWLIHTTWADQAPKFEAGTIHRLMNKTFSLSSLTQPLQDPLSKLPSARLFFT
jgi:hypothetical protein